MSTPATNVRLISPIPQQWDSTPFFSFLRKPSSNLAEEVSEVLTDEEKEQTERWFKQQEMETKEAFLKEARRKQFAHVYSSEPRVKKR